jgi:hypothetical protein
MDFFNNNGQFRRSRIGRIDGRLTVIYKGVSIQKVLSPNFRNYFYFPH